MEYESCYLNPNSYMINMNQTFFHNLQFSAISNNKEQRSEKQTVLFGPCSMAPTLTGQFLLVLLEAFDGNCFLLLLAHGYSSNADWFP